MRPSEVTKHQCSLTWRPPRDDGGAKVTHYMVEKKEKGKDHWVPVSSFCKDTHFTVQGLTPDSEYAFRVSAVNDIGQGAPLEAETTVVAKMPFGERSWGGPEAPERPPAALPSRRQARQARGTASDGGGRRFRAPLVGSSQL